MEIDKENILYEHRSKKIKTSAKTCAISLRMMNIKINSHDIVKKPSTKNNKNMCKQNSMKNVIHISKPSSTTENNLIKCTSEYMINNKCKKSEKCLIFTNICIIAKISKYLNYHDVMNLRNINKTFNKVYLSYKFSVPDIINRPINYNKTQYKRFSEIFKDIQVNCIDNKKTMFLVKKGNLNIRNCVRN